MRFVLCLLTAVLVFGSTAPASPASADSADRSKLFAIYSDTSSNKGPATLAAADACNSITHAIWGVNQWNEMLWKQEQYIYWCYDGTNVTYTYRTTPQFTYGVGWRAGGILSSSTGGGAGYPQFQAYVQGIFYRCYLTPWGEACTDYTYPWIDSTVTGYGGSGGTAGY